MWVLKIDGFKVGRHSDYVMSCGPGTNSLYGYRGNAIFTEEVDLNITKPRRRILGGLAWEGVRDSMIGVSGQSVRAERTTWWRNVPIGRRVNFFDVAFRGKDTLIIGGRGKKGREFRIVLGLEILSERWVGNQLGLENDV